jgi:hypothetical protein
MNAIISKYIFEKSSPFTENDSISYSVHAEGVFGAEGAGDSV